MAEVAAVATCLGISTSLLNQGSSLAFSTVDPSDIRVMAVNPPGFRLTTGSREQIP